MPNSSPMTSARRPRHWRTLPDARRVIDPKYYGLIDMGIAFAAMAAFVIHQLWTLRDRRTKKPPDNNTL